MIPLSEAEQQLVATGLILAGDYLKGCAPIAEHLNISMFITRLMDKMGIKTELIGRASAETSDIGTEFRLLVMRKRT